MIFKHFTSYLQIINSVMKSKKINKDYGNVNIYQPDNPTELFKTK